MNAFISYSMKEKMAGKAVKAIFDGLKITSFLAHNDLRVSEAWRERILEEIGRCDIFVPLLTKAFKKSDWCGQEAGAVVQRGSILIIPLSLDGTKPYGFLSPIQSNLIDPVDSPDTARDIILDAIGQKWPSFVIDVLLKDLLKANSYRGAEALMKPLVPFFDRLSKLQALEFAKQSTANGQIWAAELCRNEYLPEFLMLNKRKLPGEVFRALKYQIDKQS